MSQHAPGPWKAGPPAWYRGRHDPAAGKRPITAGPEGVIANVYGEANALLIAAAPDLLDACEAVLKFWGSHEAWGDFATLNSAAGAFGPVANAARLALEKVRGEP